MDEDEEEVKRGLVVEGKVGAGDWPKHVVVSEPMVAFVFGEIDIFAMVGVVCVVVVDVMAVKGVHI